MESTNDKCLICDEKLNRSTRLKIKCEYCDFEACRVCCETYLLSQTTPHCMNVECGKIWSRKFMSRAFTTAFMNKKYKSHREKILFEQEQALMPQTQILLERRLYKMKRLEETYDEMIQIQRMINELTERKYSLENYRRRLKNDQFEMDDVNDGNEEKYQEKESRHRTFLYRCSNELCRGFLSSRWKCNLCETWTCPDCHVNIGTHDNKEHVCKKEDVETVKLIKNDSKPCPKCGVIIFKIVGCDQMFCTQCHTPFSWKTGEIQIGRNIHNPHYFEFVRNNNAINDRNWLDMQCGRQLDMRFIRNFRDKLDYIVMSSDLDEKELIVKFLLNSCRNVVHLSDIIIPNLNGQIDNYGVYNQNQRIMYIQNTISEQQFRKNIQMNEKKRLKNLELMDLYVMVRDVTTDIFLKYFNGILEIENKLPRYLLDTDGVLIPGQDANKYVTRMRHKIIVDKLTHEYMIKELADIRDYANKCLSEIQKTYKGVQKEFNEAFELETVNSNVKNSLAEIHTIVPLPYDAIPLINIPESPRLLTASDNDSDSD